jgi:hypothetical protein
MDSKKFFEEVRESFSEASHNALLSLIDYCVRRDFHIRRQMSQGGFLTIGTEWFLKTFGKWATDYKYQQKYSSSEEIRAWRLKQKNYFLDQLRQSGSVGETAYNEGMLKIIKSEIDENPSNNQIDVKSQKPKYVNPARIIGLEEIADNKFDLRKLIALCKELNHASENESFYSVVMLVRSIIDHVPPIFGFNTFNEVSNSATKGYKENFLTLNNSVRKIADRYLHSTIQSYEDVPNENQVDCRRELDILLGEILKKFSKKI